MTLADQISSLATRIAAEINSLRNIDINSQTGTSYTLALTDNGIAVECSNASTVTVTVPPNGTVAFPVGAVIEILQVGAGKVTVAAGSGVTVNAAGGLLSTRAQWSALSLRKRATNTWVLVGDTAS